eukprot:530328-Heterocapsa_arctica.AAC.1
MAERNEARKGPKDAAMAMQPQMLHRFVPGTRARGRRGVSRRRGPWPDQSGARGHRESIGVTSWSSKRREQGKEAGPCERPGCYLAGWD